MYKPSTHFKEILLISIALSAVVVSIWMFIDSRREKPVTASEVDAAFVLCSNFGGVHSFSSTATTDIANVTTKDVQAKCRDGAWAGRRIQEQITGKPPLPGPNKEPKV